MITEDPRLDTSVPETPAAEAAPGATHDTWMALLDIARYAPSPHNGQVCRVALDGDDPGTATLLFDPIGGLPNTDPGNRFTYVGIGCFVEVLTRAAAAQGFTLDFTLKDGDVDASRPAGDYQAVGSLKLTPSAAPIVDETDLLAARTTSRLRFNRVKVPSEVIETCAQAAARFGQELVGNDERGFVKWLVGLNRKTVFYDLSDPIAREELRTFMRFSEKDAKTRGDGFSPSTLGIPGAVSKFFFNHHKIATAPVIKQIFNAIYAFAGGGVRSTFYLRGPFETHTDHVNAGRAMLSAWLELTRAGVSMQPFGSVVTNHKTNAELQGRLGTSDDPSQTLWLAGRIGYGKQPPRSYRLPVEKVVV